MRRKKDEYKIADDEYADYEAPTWKDKALNVILGLEITVVIGVIAGGVAGKIVADNRFQGVDESRFIKTIFNIPAHLPISNGEVHLNILDEFSEEEKMQLVEGIRSLDEDASGFNYKITFDNNEITKGINIRTKKHVESNDAYQVIADTSLRMGFLSATIKYPMSISFDMENVQKYKANISTVVKHELLHTLGFADLREDKDRHELMYYCCGEDLSLTDEEKKTLNTVYSPARTGLYQVDYPTSIKVVENKKVEEAEEEIVLQ